LDAAGPLSASSTQQPFSSGPGRSNVPRPAPMTGRAPAAEQRAQGLVALQRLGQ
jgi:hypothetical protein